MVTLYNALSIFYKSAQMSLENHGYVHSAFLYLVSAFHVLPSFSRLEKDCNICTRNNWYMVTYEG